MTSHELKTINTGDAVRLTPNGGHSGMDITLQNVSPAGYIYIGGEGVTELNYGYRLSPGHAWSVELNGKDALYATASTDGLQLAQLSLNLEVGS